MKIAPSHLSMLMWAARMPFRASEFGVKLGSEFRMAIAVLFEQALALQVGAYVGLVAWNRISKMTEQDRADLLRRLFELASQHLGVPLEDNPYEAYPTPSSDSDIPF